MEHMLTEDDKKWIDLGGDDLIKQSRKDALINLIEMNGIKFDAGIGKSFISPKNYVRIVRIKEFGEGPLELLERALNFEALGGELGGLAGSAIRWSLRGIFKSDRECVLIDQWDAKYEAVINKYTAFSKNQRETSAFWEAQAMNVLCLAGAIFNREMHHWNSENTKPQQALLGALGQSDNVGEAQYRKIFYLSIHPIPLIDMERFRSDAAKGVLMGINDSVAQRCRSAPAGYGDLHACAQAVSDLRSEAFYGSFGGLLKNELKSLSDMNNEVIKNSSRYHIFAKNFGVDRVKLDTTVVKKAMICCAAYILTFIKGSLAQSNALKKFKTANQRAINVWIAAFEAKAQGQELTLEQLAAD